MVWAGVTSCGQKTSLIFIDQGVKINQHVYLKMIKNKFLPWVDETFGNTGVTFQQDGATSHTAKLVQDFSKKTSRTFGLKIYGPHLLSISTQ